MTTFVDKYNRDTIDQNKELRDMLKESSGNLQSQLNKHDDILDNLKPRLGKVEGQIIAHHNRMDTMSRQIEKHTRLISEL